MRPILSHRPRRAQRQREHPLRTRSGTPGPEEPEPQKTHGRATIGCGRHSICYVQPAAGIGKLSTPAAATDLAREGGSAGAPDSRGTPDGIQSSLDCHRRALFVTTARRMTGGPSARRRPTCRARTAGERVNNSGGRRRHRSRARRCGAKLRSARASEWDVPAGRGVTGVRSGSAMDLGREAHVRAAARRAR